MAGMHLLIIDDEEDIRFALSEILEDEGYRVSTAADGEDAIGQLREGVRPDLILLDLMMPRMDGRAFREAQQADPSLNEIPVLLFSAYSDVHQIARELDAVGGLKKPVDINEMLDTIDRISDSLGA